MSIAACSASCADDDRTVHAISAPTITTSATTPAITQRITPDRCSLTQSTPPWAASRNLSCLSAWRVSVFTEFSCVLLGVTCRQVRSEVGTTTATLPVYQRIKLSVHQLCPHPAELCPPSPQEVSIQSRSLP